MPRKLTNNEFIERAKKIHGEKYDYTNSIYVTGKTKIKIDCYKHGSFWQTPYSHIIQRCGCKKCYFDRKSIEKKYTTEKFIKMAKGIHGKKYDYSKTNYIGSSIKVEIFCKYHNKPFFQIPNHHLRGAGCPICGGNLKLTNEEFITESNKIHDNKYDYSQTNYVNYITKVKIICKKHGLFYQIPNSHLNENGCPKCSKYISKSEIDFLNYLQIKERHFSLPKWKKKPVDGYDSKINTVYEFLGDYYHGNPEKYKSDKYNQTCHKTFGKLYENTFNTLNKLKSLGYNVKYIWESDWKKFKGGIDKIPNIISYK